jgi:S-adenosylmethionine decarboxylase
MWKDLAPQLLRQRIVIEGTTEEIVGPDQIRAYLIALADFTGMDRLSEPLVYSAHEMGWGGWVHWKTSGATFYSYPTTPPLFTVDCYTCRAILIEQAAQFTKTFLRAREVVWKEIST